MLRVGHNPQEQVGLAEAQPNLAPTVKASELESPTNTCKVCPRTPDGTGLELKHNQGGVSDCGSGGARTPPSTPPTYATHAGPKPTGLDAPCPIGALDLPHPAPGADFVVHERSRNHSCHSVKRSADTSSIQTIVWLHGYNRSEDPTFRIAFSHDSK
jgi:hypothetical protein